MPTKSLRAAKGLGRKVSAPQRSKSDPASKVVIKAKRAPQAQGNVGKSAPRNGSKEPRILSRVESLRLLSKLEKSGMLSMMERNGVTLRFIEENKLLSKAEDLGVLHVVSDRSSPSKIDSFAMALLAAAAAAVYVIPDSNSGLVVAQGALVVALGASAFAAFAGSQLLKDLQS